MNTQESLTQESLTREEKIKDIMQKIEKLIEYRQKEKQQKQ